MHTAYLQQLFQDSVFYFDQLALQAFQFQYAHCTIYQQYVNALNIDIAKITTLEKIPFLPIQFFKTHRVFCGNDAVQLQFKSSGTSSLTTSTHFVKNKSIYELSFNKGFTQFYGNAKDVCVLGLLPSYIENGDSSLVYMVDDLIKQSSHAASGIYLYDTNALQEVLLHNSFHQIPTLLIGVTYALLQFAEEYPMQLHDCICMMETGGMKGRGKEMTRVEVHALLSTAFGLQHIHSEYGMTELLSQAYSKQDGIFYPSRSMQVHIRDVNDPLSNSTKGKGVLNIIDLANIDSCSFIATQDVGEVFADGSFVVNGRLDASDLRGCNMLV
jgi:phenylacetate-coenzyme A ligase PaaK-like adenylate-forming protein